MSATQSSKAGYESEDARFTADLLRGLGLQVTVKRFAGEDDSFAPITLEAQLDKEDVGWRT